MKFAPVVPPQLLLQMKHHNLFGNYHLLLAHDVKDQRPLYEEILEDRRRGDDVFIIMDNSLIELGYPADTQTIVEACEVAKPDCVVLPDYLNDKNKTIEASAKAVEEWRGADLPPYMGVVQGKNYGEYMSCAKALIDMGCEYLSIPRIATETLGSRKSITEAIYREHKVRMHLLGFSNVRFFDDLLSVQCEGVMGIDSAVPIRLGAQGLPVTVNNCLNIGPRGNYWETCHTLTPQIAFNLGTMNGMISNGK